MDFISLLVCLGIERWSSFGRHVRKFSVLEKYIHLFRSLRFNAYGNFAIILLPILAAILIAYFLLSSFWYGIPAFIFTLLILLYSLGEFSLSEEVIATEKKYDDDHQQEVATLLVQANDHIFAVIFWFMILGPIGAVLYRVNYLLARTPELSATASLASKFQKWLDWIPVRLLSISFAFMSHFSNVLGYWIKHVFSSVFYNEELLTGCGFAALKADVDDQSATAEEIRKHILLLIDRVLILWLVALAIMIVLWIF